MTTPAPEQPAGPVLEPDGTRTSDRSDGGPEQVDEPDRRRAQLRRGRLVTGIVAAALVVVVALVALLGGFQRRTDLITPVAAGSVITTGPYEVTLTRATLQHRTSSDEWEVVALGTALTTGTTSIAPVTGDDGFVYAKDLASGESQAIRSVGLGERGSSFDYLANLTPGLPAIPWSVSFRFSRDPGASVLLAVFEQEYTTPYLFSDERGWRATGAASTFTLPLERLPDQEY